MKATLMPPQVTGILGITASAANEKPIIAAEKYMLINITEGRIEVEAGTLELRVKCFAHGYITGNLSVCVPAQLFYKTLKSVTVEQVDLELEGNVLNVKAGKNKYKLDCLPPNEALKMDLASEMKSVKFLGDSFLKHFTTASQCTKIDDLKPFMSGVFCGIWEEKFTVIGIRNEITTVRYPKIEHIESGFKNITIPKSFLSFISAVKFDGETTLSTDGKITELVCGNITVMCRNIEDEYPIKFVMGIIDSNKNNQNSIVLKTKEFLDSLNRIKMFVDFNDKIMAIDIKESEIEIIGENEGFNTAAYEVVDLEENNECKVFLGYNAGWAYQLISNIGSPSVRIYPAEKKPNFIYPESDNPEEVWILMPAMTQRAKEKREKKLADAGKR